MGILIDYQEAKAKLNQPRPVTSVPNALEDAIASFALSQMSKRNRVALILSEIFGGDPENLLDKADEVIYYASSDFTLPYKVPVKASDLTIGDIVDDSR